MKKIEKETLEGYVELGYPDAEIAKELQCAPLTAQNWRGKFGIPPAQPFKRFKRKFNKKYAPFAYQGLSAIETFKAMRQERKTLEKIGKYFGFSREYARQVRNKLNLYYSSVKESEDKGQEPSLETISYKS